jgi:hypothetical protein
MAPTGHFLSGLKRRHLDACRAIIDRLVAAVCAWPVPCPRKRTSGLLPFAIGACWRLIHAPHCLAAAPPVARSASSGDYFVTDWSYRAASSDRRCTLVIQGFALQPLLRLLRFQDDGAIERESHARVIVMQAAGRKNRSDRSVKVSAFSRHARARSTQ